MDIGLHLRRFRIKLRNLRSPPSYWVIVSLFAFLFLIVTLTEFGSQKKLKGKPIVMTSVIISNKKTRFQHTKEVLESLDFFADIQHKLPVDYNSARIQDELVALGFGNAGGRTRKAMSLKLTHFDVMRDFYNSSTYDMNDWLFLFEDDIQLHDKIADPSTLLEKGVEAAAMDGILFLGFCGPFCDGRSFVVHDNVEVRKCSGYCSHAYAIVKWKIKFFLAVFDILRDDFKLDENIVHVDWWLQKYAKRVSPIMLLGSNLPSPCDPSHLGVFFQDRRIFNSTLVD